MVRIALETQVVSFHVEKENYSAPRYHTFCMWTHYPACGVTGTSCYRFEFVVIN